MGWLALRRFGAWFCALVGTHLAVFGALPLAFADLHTRVALFSVNALPWYPLYRFDLPVTRYGWLILPNALGWTWCALVWTALYALLAMKLTRIALRRA
jgi:hypothetical protein